MDIEYIYKNKVGIAILIFFQITAVLLSYKVFENIGLFSSIMTLIIAWLTIIYLNQQNNYQTTP